MGFSGGLCYLLGLANKTRSQRQKISLLFYRAMGEYKQETRGE